MASSKLSALTELAAEPATTDEFYINDGGVSKKIQYTTLETNIASEANVKAALDGATVTNAVITGADKVLFQDATDSDNLKQDDAQTLANLATPEGTAILSTGEAGGTKFLREDGDGTCSWQAVTTELSTDTTPQLGGDLDVNGNEIQSSANVVFQLGDNAGTNKLSIQDSGGTEVAHVDSDGIGHFSPTRPAHIGGDATGAFVHNTSTTISIAGNQGVTLSSYSPTATAFLSQTQGLFFDFDDAASRMEVGRNVNPSGTFEIGFAALASDVAARDLEIQGNNAYASASVNQDAGHVAVKLGDHASGGGSAGEFRILAPDDSVVLSVDETGLLDAQSGNDLSVKLGDAAGANALIVHDSGGTVQLSFNSDAGLATGNSTASGDYSSAQGIACTASGSYSFAQGYYNTASTNWAIALGAEASNPLRSTIALGCVKFAAAGDAQSMWGTAKAATTDATQTAMTNNNNITIPADTSWAFSVLVIGRSDESDGNDSAAYRLEGLLARDESNSTALVGSVTKTVIAESAGATAWDATAEADDTNEALAIKVTGEASTNIRWVAKVDIAQVTYA